MPRTKKDRREQGLVTLVSRIFGLTGTDALVLGYLLEAGDSLSVQGISSVVRRSERSIRSSLGGLVARGLLTKRASVSTKKRLTYLYSSGPVERIIGVARGEVLNQLAGLERFEGRLAPSPGKGTGQ